MWPERWTECLICCEYKRTICLNGIWYKFCTATHPILGDPLTALGHTIMHMLLILLFANRDCIYGGQYWMAWMYRVCLFWAAVWGKLLSTCRCSKPQQGPVPVPGGPIDLLAQPCSAPDGAAWSCLTSSGHSALTCQFLWCSDKIVGVFDCDYCWCRAARQGVGKASPAAPLLVTQGITYARQLCMNKRRVLLNLYMSWEGTESMSLGWHESELESHSIRVCVCELTERVLVSRLRAW